MAKARLSATNRPNAAGLDSLQRRLVRAYTDSAMRDSRKALRRATPTPPASCAATPQATPRLSGEPRPTARALPPAASQTDLRAAATRRHSARARRDARAAGRADGARARGFTAQDARRAGLHAGDRRRARTASWRRATSTRNDVSPTRLGIGAIVMSILSMRGDEIVAQSIVLDVWRNYPQSDRTATDLDKPQEALGLVRDVSRALERVSWRSRADPKRVLVFDLENQTGNDSVNVVARQLSDSLRAAIAKRLGARDRDRFGGAVDARRVGAPRCGCAIRRRRARRGRTVSRARRLGLAASLDARHVRGSERSRPSRSRLPRAELLAGFQSVADRLLADLGQVNWGPKQVALSSSESRGGMGGR